MRKFTPLDIFRGVSGYELRLEAGIMKTSAEIQSEIIGRAAEDAEFRARLLADAGKVLKDELGVAVPDGLTISVHEESGTNAHIVLPRSGRLSSEELAGVSGGHWVW
jgi:outer membrane biogenesis lipoprotein LolB